MEHGPYSVIYADPPWSYKVWSKAQENRRTASSHYPTQGPEFIQSLPVESLAAKDCALFLWAVMPSLPEAIATMEAWGFTFKTTAFTWVKRTRTWQPWHFGGKWHFGMGFWTRANAELCLLGTRGSPRRVDKGVPQIVESRFRGHSAKPPEVRDRIVRLMGDVPRIELFARERVDGWDCMGDEIDGRDIRDALLQRMSS